MAGGLLGSTVKEDVPGTPKWRTQSVKIIFETDDLLYSTDISREQEMEANHFAKAVRSAAERHRR